MSVSFFPSLKAYTFERVLECTFPPVGGSASIQVVFMRMFDACRRGAVTIIKKMHDGKRGTEHGSN